MSIHEVIFYIDPLEFGGNSYFFHGFFFNMLEVQEFIRENRKAGNIIRAICAFLHNSEDIDINREQHPELCNW